jgi:enoyl-CoA hydratase/carnithine racemase
MAYETVLYSREPPCGIITLNRPDKLNALSTQLMEELTSLLQEAARDDEVRVIIITGQERFFSTGADFNEMVSKGSVPETFDYLNSFRRLTEAIEENPKPVIAAISGYCITGGLELALACDIRIASEDAQFAVTSARIGSVAGAGGTQRLPRIVGMAKAKEMFFSAQFIDAQEAKAIGLLNRVVPRGRVLEEAKAMAIQFAQQAPLSLRLIKQAINKGMEVDLRTGLDIEAQCVAIAWTTEDKAEGMRAFLEKRKPVFKGR